MTNPQEIEADGIARIPANENPWYILMTLYGEYEDKHDDNLINLNKHAFEIWKDVHHTSHNEIVNRFHRLAYERTSKQIELPEPESKIVFTKTHFDKPLHISFNHNQKIKFDECKFDERINISKASLNDGLIFTKSLFIKPILIDNSHIKSVFFSNCTLDDSLNIIGCYNLNDGLVINQKTTIKKHCKIINIRTDTINITDSIFHSFVSFENNTAKLTYLTNNKYSKRFIFKNNTEMNHVTFEHSHFYDETEFQSNNINGYVDFKNTTFHNNIIFSDCNFMQHSHFHECNITGELYFKNTTFHAANFYKAKFHGIADFKELTFGSFARFHHAKFFRTAKFHKELNENVSFQGADFSEIIKSYKNKEDAYDGILYFQILKKYMENNKRHEDELLFFKYELQTKEFINKTYESHGWFKNIPFRCYDIFSDYGMSLERPAIWLVFLWYLGFLLFQFEMPLSAATKLSVANMLFPFGLHKLYNLKIDELTIFHEAITFLQIILGSVFLFLIGLGLRNRFKIK